MSTRGMGSQVLMREARTTGLKKVRQGMKVGEVGVEGKAKANNRQTLSLKSNRPLGLKKERRGSSSEKSKRNWGGGSRVRGGKVCDLLKSKCLTEKKWTRGERHYFAPSKLVRRGRGPDIEDSDCIPPRFWEEARRGWPGTILRGKP